MSREEDSRREFLKTAVAIGGASALSACLEAPSAGREPIPRGDPGAVPARQFAWNDRVRTDEHGNTLLPRHQVLLYLDLDRDGPPTESDREVLEAALSTLDRAYERSHRGLLYSMAYSPAYFERFDRSLPASVDLPRPRRLSNFEEPDLDEQDALLHLASDRPEAVLEAEQALRGERDRANAVAVDRALTEVVTVDDRRTGFVGAGMPAARQDVEGVPGSRPVPEESPLFMGFEAGFRGNQATEEYVTISEGPFAGATTKHVANLRQRLEDWYDEQSFEERVMEMFSPEHAERGLVEGVGDNLGANSRVDEVTDDLLEQAREYGRVGHAQKAARANRDAEGNVLLLRRHFESTDDGVASLHFPSLQREVSQFEAVREAMNGQDVTAETPAVRNRVNNGILEYVFVRHRGNFLVPPTDLRALPPARPSTA
jgi:hypothetical protein